MRRYAQFFISAFLTLALVLFAVPGWSQQVPASDAHTLDLLQKITLATATSGDEQNLRAVIRAELGNAVSLQETRNGDLVAKLPGQTAGPIILLSAHMDEVGFQVRSITPEGFLKVAPLGLWYAGSMLDHIVTVHTSLGPVTGVVGVRPPHLMTAQEKLQSPGVSDLYIDIGATSDAQAHKMGVQLGDRITPQSSFLQLGNSGRFVSKAWDDRVGCALLVQVARQLAHTSHPNTIYVAWTTSEEFGRANGTVEMSGLKPDFVIVVEVGLTADTPDATADRHQETLGAGPVLDLYDGSISTTPRIRSWFSEQAKFAGVPLQYTTIMQEGFGVNSQNNSFLFRAPSTALLVPLRYAHSPHGVIDIHDYLQTRTLLTHVLTALDESALRKMTGKE